MSRNKIDEAKLRSLGVSDEVIESMDIRDGGNIDPQGNVLFLYREDGKCVINQDKCMGCGWCKLECKSGALRTQQTFPMRSSVNEYFL